MRVLFHWDNWVWFSTWNYDGRFRKCRIIHFGPVSIWITLGDMT